MSREKLKGLLERGTWLVLEILFFVLLSALVGELVVTYLFDFTWQQDQSVLRHTLWVLGSGAITLGAGTWIVSQSLRVVREFRSQGGSDTQTAGAAAEQTLSFQPQYHVRTQVNHHWVWMPAMDPQRLAVGQERLRILAEGHQVSEGVVTFSQQMSQPRRQRAKWLKSALSCLASSAIMGEILTKGLLKIAASSTFSWQTHLALSTLIGLLGCAIIYGLSRVYLRFKRNT